MVHYGGYSTKPAFNRRFFVEGFRGGLYFVRKHYGPVVYLLYRFFLFFGVLIFLPFFVLSYPFKKENFKERLLAYCDILILSAR